MSEFIKIEKHPAFNSGEGIDAELRSYANSVKGKTIKNLKLSDGGDEWVLETECGGEIRISGFADLYATDSPICRISVGYSA